MRSATLFAVVTTAFVSMLLPGCCCPRFCCPPGGAEPAPDNGLEAPPPALQPGVVQIFRNDPNERLVGYMSPDPMDGTTTWWLLNADEEPPVVPPLTAGYNVVMKHLAETTSHTGSELCDLYWTKLDPHPKVWKLVRMGPATPCH